MNLTDELILRQVNHHPVCGILTFRQKVEARLKRRLKKTGRVLATIETATRDDWWTLLYASWLAMHEVVAEVRR